MKGPPMKSSPGIRVLPVPGIPDIHPGDALADILGDGLARIGGVETGDILCLAHKVVSKAEGKVIALRDVVPSAAARDYAQALNKDPAKVEVVLSQSQRVVKTWKRPEQRQGTMICQHKLGFIAANAGVDESNTLAGTVITLPDAPDRSAATLGRALETRFGVTLGVVITDTFGRPWRRGQVNVAIGLYQVPAKHSEVGRKDAWGRPLHVTEPAFSDELAAASGLVVSKAGKTPLVVVRGIDWTPHPTTTARDLVRTSTEDMFR